MANPKFTRRKITLICLIVVAVGIKVFALFPEAVEKSYSRGLYPVIARSLRFLFGWVPFSVGDLLYGAVGIIVLLRVVRGIKRLVRHQAARGWLWRLCGRTLFVLLWVYVVFNVLWGLNYDREGIAEQMGLQVRPYSNADLFGLTSTVVEELNSLRDTAAARRVDMAKFALLRARAVEAYDSDARFDPALTYKSRSVKASLYSYPGLYIGFAGYYNPFSGEAQVNVGDPVFSLPYTTCHEMGHQLGYAKEDEANFVGFLAARSSMDPAFQYSVYLELYRYAFRELYFRDSSLAKMLRSKIAPGVREDLRELQRFNQKYENPIEPWIWKVYGRYLKANRQPRGIVTYTDLTAWLVAYGRKFGIDAIRPPHPVVPIVPLDLLPGAARPEAGSPAPGPGTH